MPSDLRAGAVAALCVLGSAVAAEPSPNAIAFAGLKKVAVSVSISFQGDGLPEVYASPLHGTAVDTLAASAVDVVDGDGRCAGCGVFYVSFVVRAGRAGEVQVLARSFLARKVTLGKQSLMATVWPGTQELFLVGSADLDERLRDEAKRAAAAFLAARKAALAEK